MTGEGEDGIFAVSFVDAPAIEANFVALTKAAEARRVVLDRSKHILTGPLLIPDQPIYRNDREIGEYYILFRRPEIEAIAAKMLRTGSAIRTTTHQHAEALEGNQLTELWIVTDPARDKSQALGLDKLPAGTLCVSYKINDPRYWREEVLTGNVRGFSLEGLFNFNRVNMSKSTEKKKPGKMAALLSAIFGVLLDEDTAGLVGEAKKDETDSGTPYLIFELADGSECWVDADGYATRDGENMAPGEHALKDGNVIVIDEEGKLVETQPEGEGTEAERAPAELAAIERGKAVLKARAAAKGARRDKPAAKAPAKSAELRALEERLEARIAALERQPSTRKQQPRAEGAQGAPETREELLARIVRNRRERLDATRKSY